MAAGWETAAHWVVSAPPFGVDEELDRPHSRVLVDSPASESGGMVLPRSRTATGPKMAWSRGPEVRVKTVGSPPVGVIRSSGLPLSLPSRPVDTHQQPAYSQTRERACAPACASVRAMPDWLNGTDVALREAV